MASNSFGEIFRISTWGESHGDSLGVLIDGCPAGLNLSNTMIQKELQRRRPGKRDFTSPRKEKDSAEILSGVFQGKSTGAPILIRIANKDHDSSKYEDIKDLLRPGHANYSYLKKYGSFDYRGGGRASARETAARVAAGAIAKELLSQNGIQTISWLSQISKTSSNIPLSRVLELKEQINENPFFCPDEQAFEEMKKDLQQNSLDSLGGVVSFAAFNLPPGLGEPIYLKLEALLASAMMSIPAAKAFEIGEGFEAALMKGSQHNDLFIDQDQTATNHAGGVLAGISTGMPIWGRVAFKPSSSIKLAQNTSDINGNEREFKIPEGSRHDPCVAIRATPVVEAMLALVLADALLMNRSAKL